MSPLTHTARTDPITHKYPEFSGLPTVSIMRQYNERWETGMIIQTDTGQGAKFKQNWPTIPSWTLERAAKMSQSDCQSINRNLHGYATSGGERLAPHGVRGRGWYNPRDTAHRNPITGEGMKPEDYLDTFSLPRDYRVRVERTNESIQQHEKNKARSRASGQEPTKGSKEKAVNLERPEVKKVIRPKKASVPSETVNHELENTGQRNSVDINVAATKDELDDEKDEMKTNGSPKKVNGEIETMETEDVKSEKPHSENGLTEEKVLDVQDTVAPVAEDENKDDTKESVE
ncbi:unnamed protein product [Dicrocoelium dendriticum]|nr:unnamed protein product [Dicrocoelium dendriticum]